MRYLISVYLGCFLIGVGSQYAMVKLDNPEAVWFWCRVLNLC